MHFFVHLINLKIKLFQCETLTSPDKLQNFIHKEQLLNRYGGSYVYDHQEWISFRKVKKIVVFF